MYWSRKNRSDNHLVFVNKQYQSAKWTAWFQHCVRVRRCVVLNYWCIILRNDVWGESIKRCLPLSVCKRNTRGWKCLLYSLNGRSTNVIFCLGLQTSNIWLLVFGAAHLAKASSCRFTSLAFCYQLLGSKNYSPPVSIAGWYLAESTACTCIECLMHYTPGVFIAKSLTWSETKITKMI